MSEHDHIWVAELQDAEGNELEYHSFELDPKHYATTQLWNEAHKSWSCHRQRERKNLACNRDAKCKAPFAVSWVPRDHAIFMIAPPEITHHKTLWDLYYAIGYDYKSQRYFRQAAPLERDTVYAASGPFMARMPWTSADPDIDTVLRTLIGFNIDHNTEDGMLRLSPHSSGEDNYIMAFFDIDGVHGSEILTGVRLAIYAYTQRVNSNDIKRFTFLGKRTEMVGEKYGPKV